jgi:hypothetical protein
MLSQLKRYKEHSFKLNKKTDPKRIEKCSILFGSTVERVVRKSSIPVLIIPGDKEPLEIP